ncbi:uncharacterized protein Gasu_41520 [Galdieria sulphuraria]|uniref:DH domain-containing protein n=1 Tax=Galdieria sulphuraria TaxID=130081 RepID=M2XXZ1_GALSU|nr:uncharacterized protein Gasu_41520 [Galdieria sulphuraria]EME28304.1 hypothetical protein Gasu_41520 [Galdieria sulphuraria]|eukprot:XP_005704824.1 hypothetical protein Gasu_41520 [Galdieria sulphuraria]
METKLCLCVTGCYSEFVICSIQNLFESNDKENSVNNMPTKHRQNEYLLQVFLWQTGDSFQLSLSKVSFVFQKFGIHDSCIIFDIARSSTDPTRHLLPLPTFNNYDCDKHPFLYLKPIQDCDYYDGNDIYEFYKCLLKAQALDLSIPMRSIMALEELVRTEETYLKDLNTLVDVFVLPFEEAIHVKILPASLLPDVLQSLFQNLNELSRLHAEFLQALYSYMLEGGLSRRNIGALLTSQLCQTLKLPYIDYISNYDIRNKQLCYLRNKYALLDDFIRRCEASKKCEGLCLSSLLIKPVQRVTKYDLLLTEIENGYSCFNEQIFYIKEARSAIRDLLSTVEDRITPNVNFAMRDILFKENGTTVSLQVPGRLLLMEGWLTYQEKHKMECKPYYFFLFSDILLCCYDTRSKSISRAISKFSKSKETYKIVWQEEIHSGIYIQTLEHGIPHEDFIWFQVCFDNSNRKQFCTRLVAFPEWQKAFKEASQFHQPECDNVLKESSKANILYSPCVGKSHPSVYEAS